MQFSPDQKIAFDHLSEWFRQRREAYISLGGFAGSGKTTLISEFRNHLKEIYPTIRVAFVAYTGKAASVLRDKLIRQSLQGKLESGDCCSTIHSLIYIPVQEDGETVEWRKASSLDFDLIIVDECSMVSKTIFEDLSSYKIPMICVGDHGQLPPIEAANGFNLMANPHIKLEIVHRFGTNVGLIDVSVMAREHGKIPLGVYNDQVFKVSHKDPKIKEFFKMCGEFDNSVVLCGLNDTRIEMNKKIRTSLGRIGQDPLADDRVVCLRNNKKAEGCPVYNGMLGRIVQKKEHPSFYDAKIAMDGECECFTGPISRTAFNNKKPDMSEYVILKNLLMCRRQRQTGDHYTLNNMIRNVNSKVYLDCFDFGYSITVHKSQGSEWPNVVVMEEQCPYWSGTDWNRWLYTAVTRSNSKLLIIQK